MLDLSKNNSIKMSIFFFRQMALFNEKKRCLHATKQNKKAYFPWLSERCYILILVQTPALLVYKPKSKAEIDE